MVIKSKPISYEGVDLIETQVCLGRLRIGAEMRVTMGATLGLIVGALVVAVGGALNYVWDEFLYERVVWLLSATSGGPRSRTHWDGKSLHLIQLANIAIWWAVTAFGLAFVLDTFAEKFTRFISFPVLCWSATGGIFCALLAISVFTIFVNAKGLSTFDLVLMHGYFVLLVGLPAWAGISIAKQAKKACPLSD